MMANKAYKFMIYLNTEQQVLFAKTSDYFVNLQEGLQDDLIARTVKEK